MTTPTPVTLAGATGLTGSSIVHSLLLSTHPFSITTLTRRPLSPSTKPQNLETSHTNQTHSDLFGAVQASSRICASGGVYVSCLGTTRAAAGSTKNQERIDLDLNRELAQKAKHDGVDTVSRRARGAVEERNTVD